MLEIILSPGVTSSGTDITECDPVPCIYVNRRVLISTLLLGRKGEKRVWTMCSFCDDEHVGMTAEVEGSRFVLLVSICAS